MFNDQDISILEDLIGALTHLADTLSSLNNFNENLVKIQKSLRQEQTLGSPEFKINPTLQEVGFQKLGDGEVAEIKRNQNAYTRIEHGPVRLKHGPSIDGEDEEE